MQLLVALVGQRTAITGVGAALGVAMMPFGDGACYEVGGGGDKNNSNRNPLPHGQNVMGFATGSSVMA